jgi:hypothetical protein
MSDKAKFNRREFLMATAKTGSGLAALGGMSFLGLPVEETAVQTPGENSSGVPSQAKATWPQEYTVEKDEQNGRLILSTPYYSIHHDLNEYYII